MPTLVIVESPTKAKTLSKFLGSEYQIEATWGHVRDLPPKKIGIEIIKKDNAFEFLPEYQVIADRKKKLDLLKTLSQKTDKIILATDPDREGEAIAYHVEEVLHHKAKFIRIVFHEITKTAIQEALLHPRNIDMQLVDAQQARRMLDRLVGYNLSPLLWNKLRKRWLSAGRVQSVAVRLIVEREREIEKFAKEEFFRIFAFFKTNKGLLEAELISKDGQQFDQTITHQLFDGPYITTKTKIDSETKALQILADLKPPFTVDTVDKKEVKRTPPPPFTTSKLQQAAFRYLYFSAKRTMQLAQKLYEEGLITYHRTDSFNLSEKFLIEAKNYIVSEFGKDYYPGNFRHYQTKSKVAQEAHEAIRPTDLSDMTKINNHSSEIPTSLYKDHLRLYELIWKRALSSQASDAIFDSTTINIISQNNYLFQTKGSIIKFEGFLKIYGRDGEDKIIPLVARGDRVDLEKADKIKSFTNPPPRYSESSLVKILEEKEIGRPSTYAPTISNIQDRQYVEKMIDPDGKHTNKFKPTDLGFLVTDFLVKYFLSIVELPFTAKMEERLDNIANGKEKWTPVLSDFYGTFKETLDSVYKKAKKVDVEVEKVGEKCPDCENALIYRIGKFGRFIACSKFPGCKYTRNIVEKIDIKCPKCGGEMVVKRTKRRKQFYGCSNYPSCQFAAWKKEDIR